MKKKIALFLVAMLLGVGLIVSCGGGGDDDGDGPGTGTGTQYTVTFNTDGGTPAKIDPITVNAGAAIGAAKWPSDPSKDGFKFGGWFEGTTEYKFDTKINKDVALKATYNVIPPYVIDLGAFTWDNNNTQRGWRADTTDNVATDLALEDLNNAKYIVLHTKGGDSDTAFSEIKVVIQSNVDSWGWNTTNIGGADFDRTEDSFIVIDISTLKHGADLAECSKGKFIIEYATGGNIVLGLGLEAGYITNKDLSALPADAVAFEDEDAAYGYVTAENILGITIPTTFSTVTFNTDGGTPAVAPVKVGSGKSLGVKYPSWVKKDGYEFVGWLSGTTAYDANTIINANVTLKALWEEIQLPTMPTDLGLTPVVINNGTNQIAFGTGGFGGGEPAQDLTLFTESKYLVLFFLGSNANRDGFGGTQIAVQSNVDKSKTGNSDWLNNATPDFTAFPNEGDKFNFVVLKLEDTAYWNTIITDTDLVGGKFVLNWGIVGSGFKAAFVTKVELDDTNWVQGGTVPIYFTSELVKK